MLEAFPDNSFTLGAEFVASALVWIANHAGGEVPGFHAMGPESPVIESIQAPPGPPLTSYSALAANYHPSGPLFWRMLYAGLEQMFTTANDLVVPADGGWRVHRSGETFIPAGFIGCFGPGGNLRAESVSHFTLFDGPEATHFLAASLLGKPHGLTAIDPTKALPDRRVLRESTSVSVPAPARAPAVATEAPAPKGVDDEALLRVTVAHGDLSFETEPLLLGHYRSRRLTGTEAVADRSLGHVMQRSLDMGLYPNVAGSHQIFLNQGGDDAAGFGDSPRTVIVAGLGDEGKMQAADLLTTVRQAVIAWVHWVSEANPSANAVKLASTLIGSGGTDVPAEESAAADRAGGSRSQCAVEGLQPIGTQLAWRHPPAVHRTLSRPGPTEAWHGLRAQQCVSPSQFVLDEYIETAIGFGLQRVLSARYRGTNHALISITTTAREGEEPVLQFTFDTKHARSEIHAHLVASALVRDLIAEPSNDRGSDPRIGPYSAQPADPHRDRSLPH